MTKLTIPQEELIISTVSEAVSRSITLAEVLTEVNKAEDARNIIALNEINNYYLIAKTGYYLKVDEPSMIYIDLFNIFDKLYLELRHALAYDNGKLNHPEEFSGLLNDVRKYFETLNSAFVERKNTYLQKGLSAND